MMNAPHLKMKLASGEQRVWVQAEVEDWETYNRPESQGGAWILAQRMKIIQEIESLGNLKKEVYYNVNTKEEGVIPIR